MNSEKEVALLRSLYPGKNIIQIPPENPSEIICEVDKVDDPQGGCSVAIAVIDHSAPHFHRRTCERYEVLDGEVELFVAGEKKLLREGDISIIAPEMVHWVQADAAWVKVIAIPAWTPEDHIIADEKAKE